MREQATTAAWVPLKEAETTYRRVQADVRMLSPFQLRWSFRRARRRAESGNTHDLVTLRAIKDEFLLRGMEPPT
jgi:hypothetical protein